jgi:hypothetical protein
MKVHDLAKYVWSLFTELKCVQIERVVYDE